MAAPGAGDARLVTPASFARRAITWEWRWRVVHFSGDLISIGLIFFCFRLKHLFDWLSRPYHSFVPKHSPSVMAAMR
jgi:hypothetical protein